MFRYCYVNAVTREKDSLEPGKEIKFECDRELGNKKGLYIHYNMDVKSFLFKKLPQRMHINESM